MGRTDGSTAFSSSASDKVAYVTEVGEDCVSVDWTELKWKISLVQRAMLWKTSIPLADAITVQLKAAASTAATKPREIL